LLGHADASFTGQQRPMIKDIIAKLENNKEIGSKEFKVWYKQNGTPKVKFKRINSTKERKILKDWTKYLS